MDIDRRQDKILAAAIFVWLIVGILTFLSWAYFNGFDLGLCETAYSHDYCVSKFDLTA